MAPLRPNLPSSSGRLAFQEEGTVVTPVVVGVSVVTSRSSCYSCDACVFHSGQDSDVVSFNLHVVHPLTVVTIWRREVSFSNQGRAIPVNDADNEEHPTTGGLGSLSDIIILPYV